MAVKLPPGMAGTPVHRQRPAQRIDGYRVELERIMDEQGRRHVWLAERLGVSRQLVNAVFNYWAPVSLMRAEKIAATLGIPVQSFYDLEAEKLIPARARDLVA